VRNYVIYAFVIFLFLAGQISAQSQIRSIEVERTYPQIPRVSAYEAYSKYKQGKAIIFHGGGIHYSKRHILGAFNLDVSDELKDERLQKFPKEGIEIFVYCY
jgi:predicted HAD superfamily hydrolase